MRTDRVGIKSVGLSIAFFCVAGLGAPILRAQAPPRYKVDPDWPRQLPNNWVFSDIHGIFADKDDHIWVVTDPAGLDENEIPAAQTPPRAGCCVPPPSVMEFDAGGNVIKSWGHPGFVPGWPVDEHGIWVDHDGNVWIGGNAGGARKPWDRQIIKLTPDGKPLLTIGHPTDEPMNNQETSFLGAPGELTVDEAEHEVYVGDGYMNRRIVIYDSNTGVFKRGWGAYGIPLSQIENGKLPPCDPGTPAKQFTGPMACVRISGDGLVYVCDRSSDRIQVFTKDGKFVKEFFVHPETTERGSVWGMTFSHDPKQAYLLVSDGEDGIIWIVNRADGKLAGQFGHKGHNAGELDAVQDITMDSQGNVYTGEVNPNRRIQKFVLQK